MDNKSPLIEATALATEIVADMELGRLPNYRILLKCRRLSRLVSDENWMKWLDLELHGYNAAQPGITHEELLYYFKHFGRELDSQKNTGLVHPLTTLEQEMETAKTALEACRVPTSLQASSAESLFPDSVSAVVNRIMLKLDELRTIVTQRQVIIARVMGLAYSFTLKWYSELQYGNIAQTIFERRRTEVDSTLKELCPRALEQFVSAYERLKSENEESWSQALLSCRRILKTFADSVFPPQKEPFIGSNGKEYEVSDDKYVNRLIAFIEQRTSSETFGSVMQAQVKYLGMRLNSILDETHKGVHREITRREADSTVLLTYLLLADIVDLIPPNKKKELETLDNGLPSK